MTPLLPALSGGPRPCFHWRASVIVIPNLFPQLHPFSPILHTPELPFEHALGSCHSPTSAPAAAPAQFDPHLSLWFQTLPGSPLCSLPSRVPPSLRALHFALLAPWKVLPRCWHGSFLSVMSLTFSKRFLFGMSCTLATSGPSPLRSLCVLFSS